MKESPLLVRIVFLLVCALCVLPAAPSYAQPLEERVVEHTLDNGMKFLFVKRGTAPVFSGVVIVRVGGVDDPQGQSGLAHLFEHMAFKGTPRIGTVDFAAEQGIMRRIDSVAVLYTQTLATVPLAHRGALEALERRTAREVVVANQGSEDYEITRALANALAETLRTAPDRYPSLRAYARAKGYLADLQRYTAIHRTFIVKDEFSRIIDRNGGVDNNAGTGKDYTIYYESFPANRLELWALLESERFMNPVMREFYSERDVVAEERRMRTDDDPEGKLYEQFMATAMQAHPYRIPIVGWMSEVEKVTAQDAAAFREAYYVPSNTVGVIVGNISVDSAKAFVDRYFGRIPSTNRRAPEVRTVEPPQAGERRVSVDFDAEPQLMVGYHKPNYPDPDAYVFSVIANILRDSGNSSRLYRRLVQTGIASDVAVYEELPGQRYPNLFVLHASPAAPHTTGEVEEILYSELDSLARVPVSEAELTKCKNQLEASYIREISDNNSLAQALARAQAIHGDWRVVTEHRANVSKVTADDVMRVARLYFKPQNRTVAAIVRENEQNNGRGREDQ